MIGEGDAAPVLTFGPVDGNIHVRTSDTFSASEPFAFSVDLSAPAVTFEKARFKIRLDFGDDEEDGDDNDDAFFEVAPRDVERAREHGHVLVGGVGVRHDLRP